jgi:hypothetical protein
MFLMPMENRFDQTQYPLTAKNGLGRSKLTYIISVIIALTLSATLLFGYWYLRRQHAERAEAQLKSQAVVSKPALQPSVEIIENDAMLKGSQAIVSGNLVNISTATLSNLILEFELRRRKDGVLESREIAVTPDKIEPNQQGKYTLVLPRDYSTAKIKRLASGAGSNELGFKTTPGLQRPPEPPPQTVKTIIIKRPANKGQANDFINTPDTPAKVP